MQISGFLDNAAARAIFGFTLEPVHRILYACLEQLAANGAEWKRELQLDLMLFRIHHLDPESHIPLPAQPPGFRREHLPRRGFPFWHDALGVCVPPDIIEGWLTEQFPSAFNWGCNNGYWTDREAHTFSSFQRAQFSSMMSFSRRLAHFSKTLISNDC